MTPHGTNRMKPDSPCNLALIVSMLLIGAVLTGCLFATRTISPQMEAKAWLLQSLTHDLGRPTAAGSVEFGLGDTTMAAGELVWHEPSPSNDRPELFPEGRECIYAVKWEGSTNCYEDDTWEFFEDGKAKLSFGSNLCDAAGPESLSGHWAMNSPDTELTLAFPGDTVVFQVEELEDDIKRLSKTTIETDACGGMVYIKTQFSFRAK
jgi:hypothetical protein